MYLIIYSYIYLSIYLFILVRSTAEEPLAAVVGRLVEWHRSGSPTWLRTTAQWSGRDPR